MAYQGTRSKSQVSTQSPELDRNMSGQLSPALAIGGALSQSSGDEAPRVSLMEKLFNKSPKKTYAEPLDLGPDLNVRPRYRLMGQGDVHSSGPAAVAGLDVGSPQPKIVHSSGPAAVAGLDVGSPRPKMADTAVDSGSESDDKHSVKSFARRFKESLSEALSSVVTSVKKMGDEIKELRESIHSSRKLQNNSTSPCSHEVCIDESDESVKQRVHDLRPNKSHTQSDSGKRHKRKTHIPTKNKHQKPVKFYISSSSESDSSTESDDDQDSDLSILETPVAVSKSRSSIMGTNERHAKIPPFTGKGETWVVWYNRFEEASKR